MQLQRCNKAGYTLIEVLVVVIIMGILSTMGAVGVQDAVANSRVKGAAVNTAAFLERVGNLAKQRSEVICVAVEPGNPQVLLAVKSKGTDCSNDNRIGGGVLARLLIDAPAQFVENKSGTCNFYGAADGVDLLGENAVFKSRIGLSSVPSGALCIQYGDDMRFGLAQKQSTSNAVKAFWRIGNDNGADSWSEL